MSDDDTGEFPVPSYTARATRLLSDRLAADGFGGFDPSVLLPVLLDLLGKLLDCQPTPTEGYDFLTWKPRNTPRWLDWLFGSFESRLYTYRQGINARITNAVAWTVSHRDAFVRALWAAVDAGNLTPELMGGLYREARS